MKRLWHRPCRFSRPMYGTLLGRPIITTEAAAGRDWLVGEAITLADFSVAAGLCYCIQAKFPMDAYPNIRAWYQRMEALPAWQKSAPQTP